MKNSGRSAEKAELFPCSEDKKGFSILEVLVAISILTIMLIAIYQSFNTSLLIISSSQNLWKAIVYTQNELSLWERSVHAPLAIAQGKFEEDQPMAGFEWVRETSDISPLPGVTVRKVAYDLKWHEGNKEFSYSAAIYIKPN